MKISLTNMILYVALGVCLLAAMVFCVQTVNINGDLRNYNGRVTAINTWRATLQSLVADCLEYSNRNPAIVPILEQAGIKGNKPMAAPASKPATK